MSVIVLDFETAWSSKDYTLSKMGPIEYIRDFRFHAQMVGVSVDFAPAVVYDEEDIAPALRSLQLDNPGNVVVGHNINGFDALILSERYGICPVTVVDTIAMMRWCGLSRSMGESHKALTEYLGNGVKTAGTVISDGKRTRADFSRAEWLAFRQYCADDVNQCAANFRKMLPYMTPDALLFASITARMASEPAFILDKSMLEAFLVKLDQRTEDARLDLMRVFRFGSTEEMLKAIRSAASFATMLRALGVEPPLKVSDAKTATKKARLESIVSLGGSDAAGAQAMLDARAYMVKTYAFAKTDLDFTALQDYPDERVALLVRTKLEHSSSGLRSRTQRFLNLANLGSTLPVMLNVYKAHTSRYTAGNSEGAGDGTNLQNLGKRNALIAELRRAVRVLDGMCVVAGDSSQIEARMLAYEARQDTLVEQFRENRDPYAELAEYIFSVPANEIHDGAKAGDKKLKMMRNVGKTAVLSAGYQVGATKFSNTLLRSGIRLSEDLDKHHELAKHAHYVYRETNANIVRLWDTCQQVVEAMYTGVSGSFGGPDDSLFEYGMRMMPYGSEPVASIKLPSGYILWYPGLNWEQDERGYKSFYYMQQKGTKSFKSRIYGGSLTENITQALAFQLLMWQACNMTRTGVILHANIHDSWASVVPITQGETVKLVMEHWLTTTPSWSPGLPLGCDVEIGYDYSVV